MSPTAWPASAAVIPIRMDVNPLPRCSASVVPGDAGAPRRSEQGVRYVTGEVGPSLHGGVDVDVETGTRSPQRRPSVLTG